MSSKKNADEPVVFDGLRKAVANIRQRKNLYQKVTAARAGITSNDWSRIENGAKKRLGAAEREIILTGLECTEIELWEEKVRVERDHYRQLAIERGEDRPGYDSSPLAAYVEKLHRLDVANLPEETRDAFNGLRHSAAASLAQAFTLIDQVCGMYQAGRIDASNS